MNTFYQQEQDGGSPSNTAAFIEAAKYQRGNRLTYLPGSYRWKTQMDIASEKIFDTDDKKRVGVDEWLVEMQTSIGDILKTDYPNLFGKK